MAIYDMAASAVENYFRYCLRLKEASRTLASYVTPSKINLNGRMASDQMIEHQCLVVEACAATVEMMEKQLGIQPPPNDAQ